MEEFACASWWGSVDIAFAICMHGDGIAHEDARMGLHEQATRSDGGATFRSWMSSMNGVVISIAVLHILFSRCGHSTMSFQVLLVAHRN